VAGPPGPEIRPETDSDKDRTITWRSALLALFAALLAALIAAGSAYLTAIVQADRQAKQSRDEFLRTRRQVAYARLAADGRVHGQDYLQCERDAGSSQYMITAAALRAKETTLRGFLDSVAGDASVVEIIGTPDVSKFATELEADLYQVVKVCIDGLRLHVAGSKPTELQKASQAVHIAIDTTIGDFELFLRSCQSDLQD
jgi:hypothetical protein